MYLKKDVVLTSPDMSKLKAVKIDQRTTIYVPLDRDPEVARAKYWFHREGKKEEEKVQ